MIFMTLALSQVVMANMTTMRSYDADCDHFGECGKSVALDYDLPACSLSVYY